MDHCCVVEWQVGVGLLDEETNLGTTQDNSFCACFFQIIVNSFVEKDKTGAVVEVLFASSNHEKVKAKYEELVAQYPENYLAIYNYY